MPARRKRVLEARVGFMHSGRIVTVPLTHTAIQGMTGVGKSTAEKRLIHEFASRGVRFLLIDVKQERDFLGVGHETRPFLRESTNPLLLKAVLESQAGWSLTGMFGTILVICQGAGNIADVRQNAALMAADPRVRPQRREEANKLIFFLDELLRQISIGDFADDLELPEQVNVMNISPYPRSIQQLIVDGVLSTILRREHNLVVVIEEIINFAGQSESSEAESTIRQYIREGRASGLWLWIAGQSVTEIDKRVLKQMLVWIMGRQMEQNEAVRIVKQIPKATIKADDIKTLPKGWFYTVIANEDNVTVRKVFIWPTWMKGIDAMAIASGRKKISQLKHREADEMGEAERAEIKRLNVELQKSRTTNKELSARLKDVMAQVEILQKGGSDESKDRGRADAAEAGERNEKRNTTPEGNGAVGDRVAVVGPEHESGQDEEREAQGPPVGNAEAAEEKVNVKVIDNQPTITLEVQRGVATFTTDTLDGKIGKLIVDDFFVRSKVFTEVLTEADRRGWTTLRKQQGEFAKHLRWFCSQDYMRQEKMSNGQWKFLQLPDAKKRMIIKEV